MLPGFKLDVSKMNLIEHAKMPLSCFKLFVYQKNQNSPCCSAGLAKSADELFE